MDSQSELDRILQIIALKYQTEFEPLEIDGQKLQTLNITNMQNILDGLVATNVIHNPVLDLPLWAKIWPAAMVLGRFLRKFDVAGKTMLELGAGMGICSLIGATYGLARIVVSDGNSDALNFINANIHLNGLANFVSATQLDLNKPENRSRFSERFDFICASELLYLESLHKPILKFMDHNLKSGGKALFCSDYKRNNPRFKKLAAKNYKVSEGPVAIRNVDEAGCQLFNILILERP